MVRYLLDELYTYEEDHGDALCPIDRQAHKSHAGEAELVKPLCTDEARYMFAMQNLHTKQVVQESTMLALAQYTSISNVSHNLQSLTLDRAPAPFMDNRNRSSPSKPASHVSVALDRRGSLNLQSISAAITVGSSHSVLTRPAPDAVARVIPRVPEGEKGWRQVIKDWNEPDLQQGLTVALKDWPAEWYSRSNSASATLGSKRKQREIIALEFINTYIPFNQVKLTSF